MKNKVNRARQRLPLLACYPHDFYIRSVINLTIKNKTEKKLAVLTSVIRIKNGFPNVW